MTAMLGPHRTAKGKTDTWLTPPWILSALGPFDLDPCCPATMPWVTATTMYQEPADGLALPLGRPRMAQSAVWEGYRGVAG
ncbi:MAG: hypothetical protein LUE17_12120 [Planctomycetaceae bacterium]|nr:hypothetical protein [Planctomycetaceae bacterium]